MNLNDPFNRLSRQQNIEYIKFKESLQKSCIDSHQDAEALLKNIRHRALLFSILIVTFASVIAIFLPKLKAIVIVFSLLVLLWLFSITLKGQKFMRRYIQERFSEES